MSNPSKYTKSLALAFIFLTIVALAILLQFWYFNIVLELYGNGGTGLEPGTFGDMFGGLNTLFSGVALAGIIITMTLQQMQLAQQQKTNEEIISDLDLNRRAQTRKSQMEIVHIPNKGSATQIHLKNRGPSGASIVLKSRGKNLSTKGFAQWKDGATQALQFESAVIEDEIAFEYLDTLGYKRFFSMAISPGKPIRIRNPYHKLASEITEDKRGI